MASKLLFLGGAASQVEIIRKAQRRGINALVCDWDAHAPGAAEADEFVQVSTTDFDSLVGVARSHRVDGVVAYATDRAAPVAARLARACNLASNDPEMVATLCSKDRFRAFLKENGFNVPRTVIVGDDAMVDTGQMEFPVVVKPTDSAGSRGVTRCDSPDELESALAKAKRISRNGKVIVEEFIQRAHPNVIEAELFVVDGEVTTWGLMDCIRDDACNPLVPAAYAYPLDLDVRYVDLVRSEIERFVEATGIQVGAFNMEMVIDREGRLYFLDVGPRSGGNMLPEFIGRIGGIDIMGATIQASLGERIDRNSLWLDGRSGGQWGHIALHSLRGGAFQGVRYSKDVLPCLVREVLDVNSGDRVHPLRTGEDVLGLATLKFKTLSQRRRIMGDLDGHIQVVTTED